MRLDEILTESLIIFATTLGNGDTNSGIRRCVELTQQMRAREHVPMIQIKDFLQHRYYTGPLNERTCPALDLYREYCEWRKGSGRNCLPRNKFYRTLNLSNLVLIKKSSGNRLYVYGLYPKYDEEVRRVKPIEKPTDEQLEKADIEDYFESDVDEDDEWELD